MNLYADLARTMIARLETYRVAIIPKPDGTVSFFVPSPGEFGRPKADGAYIQGTQDGSIRELQLLIRSSPQLKQAVIDEISCRGSLADEGSHDFNLTL
ncbi:hypothetical protein [Sphingobium sp. TomTYG45]